MQLLYTIVRPVFLFTLIYIFSIPVFPQEVVAEFGKYKITLDEFEHAYAKNSGGWENAVGDSIKDYENFLNLYLKFKMKLRDAQVRGYHKDEDLINELNDYQKQVGVSYILEKELNEPGLRRLYDRRKEELRVSHIMVRPDTLSDDEAREKAVSILDSIKNGASFEELANIYSDDKFSGPTGGDIYFVTAGLLPYEFEDAMYELQEGEVYPEPVKTRYGYHLIKVTKRQTRIPKIRARHILINYMNEDGKMDSAAAKITADSVLTLIKEGQDFDALVKRFSDDTGTKDKVGDLGFFERRMMVKEFDEAAFNLEVGEISDLVQTNFGYHIIKLMEKAPMPAFEEDKENLKNLYTKQRAQADREQLVNSYKQKYNYTLNEDVVDYLVENSDSIRFGQVHPKLSEIGDRILFSYSDKDVNIASFLEAANQNSKVTARQMDKREEVMLVINAVTEDLILEESALRLPEENGEFASLMDDYRDGIFIFKIQEEEVWNKLKIDSVDVYDYWEQNKEKYSWPERISFSEIFSTKDSLISKYFEMLEAGAAFDTIAALYTERPGKKEVKGFYELQDVNFSDFSKEANQIQKVEEYSKPVPFSGGYSIFKLNDRQPERLKTFEEAKAEASGEYQEMFSKKLESEYIKSLEKRYEPEMYYDVLEKAFTTRTDN
jgi:peptidyl-prolyl cis-trans isomerase SurA